MTFPTNTTVLDAFTRADNASPGANWTLYYGDNSQLQIISNTAAGDNSGLYSGSYWNPSTFGPDAENYVDVPTPGSNASREFTLSVRATGTLGSSPSGYLLMVTLSTNTWHLFRLDTGAQTLLGATFSQTVSAGDSVGVSIVGSTLTAYYKASGGSWTSLTTRTDTTYSAAGRHAVEIHDNTTRLDNFSGGTVVASGLTFATPGAPSLEAEGTQVFTQSGLASAWQGAPTTGYSGLEQFTAGGTLALPGAASTDSSGSQVFTGGGTTAPPGAAPTDSSGVQAFTLATQTLASQGAASTDGSGSQTFTGGSNAAIAGAATTDSSGALSLTGGGSAALQGAVPTDNSGVTTFATQTQTLAFQGAPSDSLAGVASFNNPVAGSSSFAISGAPTSESGGVTTFALPTGTLAFQGAPADSAAGGQVFGLGSTAAFKGAASGESLGVSAFVTTQFFAVAGAPSYDSSGVANWLAPFSPSFAIKGAASDSFAGASRFGLFVAATVPNMRGSSRALASYQGIGSKAATRQGSSFRVTVGWVGGSIVVKPYGGGSQRNQ